MYFSKFAFFDKKKSQETTYNYFRHDISKVNIESVRPW